MEEANKKATFLSNERWGELDFCGISTHELIGGQTIVMGTVVIGNTEDSLYVKYQADPGYILTETHLFVGDVMSDDFPKAGKGNPKIGHFPNATENFGGSNIVMYSIALDDIDPKSNGCFDIAAHAVVECEDGTCEETAWGAGEIKNEIVFASKSTFIIPDLYTTTAKTQGISYVDEEDCWWGPTFGYYILDLIDFTPTTVSLSTTSGSELGTLNVSIEGDDLVFTMAGANGAILNSPFLFVGDLYDLFSYTIEGGCPDWKNFPYQEAVTRIPLSDFSGGTTGEAMEFEGRRWGFYFEYCASCN